MASASDDTTICIYDFTNTINGTQTKANASLLRILKGHRGAVVGLCWSPHNPKLLVSASLDGTAQVIFLMITLILRFGMRLLEKEFVIIEVTKICN